MSDINALINTLLYDLKRITNQQNNNRHNYYLIFRYISTSKGFRAVFLYRLINYFSIKNKLKLKSLFCFLNFVFCNIEISCQAKIGHGLLIPHAQNIVIGKGVILGSDVTVQQGVTIGANMNKERDGVKYPTVGNNVLIGAGAKVLGPVIVGSNSIIGANAVVVESIPDNSTAVGVPAKVVKMN